MLREFWSRPWSVKRHSIDPSVAFCAEPGLLVACLSNSFVHSVDPKACFDSTPFQARPVFHQRGPEVPPAPCTHLQCLLRIAHNSLWFLKGEHCTSVTLKSVIASANKSMHFYGGSTTEILIMFSGTICTSVAFNFLQNQRKSFTLYLVYTTN